jgi:hypothetical protein
MTRSRSEAAIKGRSIEVSSRLGADAGRLGVDAGMLGGDAGELGVDAGKLGADTDKGAGLPSLGVNAGKRTGVPSRSRIPNFFVTRTAS